MASAPIQPLVFPRVFAWKRVRATVLISAILGLVLSGPFQTGTPVVVIRAVIVGLVCMTLYGVFERWPKQLPRWISRTALQLIAVAVVIPFASGFVSLLITDPAVKLDQRHSAIEYVVFVLIGMLFAPWIAVAAKLKQRDLLAREQSLAFELERSELRRNALDAKLRVLKSQIEPHFLFNTLANIQALVNAGSPQAAQVLENLIAYLRAAVPRLHQSMTNLADEIELASAYLKLMKMRIPDRLDFAVKIDPAALKVQCPPMCLLTLVENAVRHGIDPSEEGGRVDIEVQVHRQRCVVSVSDTGLGLKMSNAGLGTGLSTLRERLQLTYGDAARLTLTEIQPHGVHVEIEFPVQVSQ